MKTMPRYLSILLYVIPLLTGHSALAQAPPVKAEIVTVGMVPIPGKYHYLNGAKIEAFQIGMNGLDQAFVYQGPPVMLIHREASGFEKPLKGQPPVKPAASVRIPAGADRVLLVCNLINDDELQVRSYDISSAKVKNGSYRFFNFSGKNLAFILGGEKFSVKMGESEMVSNAGWQSAVMDIPVQIGAVNADQKAVKMIYSSIWGHRPVRRNIIFVLDSPRSPKGVQLRRFYDIPQP